MKKLKRLKNNSKTSIAIVCLLVLAMISSTSFSTTFIASAKTNAIDSSLINYGMESCAGNNSRSFVGMGPGVTTPNLQWTANIPGVTVDGSASMSAFDGYVFVQNSTHTIALNAANGNLVYAIPLPYTGMGPYEAYNLIIASEPVDIGGGYMLISGNCYSTSTGQLVWRAPAGFSAGIAVNSGIGALTVDPDYLPDPMFFTGGRGAPIVGWVLDNPAQPPTVLWNITGTDAPTGTAFVYGNGVVVYTGAGQTFQGYNATNGKFMWSVTVKGLQLYGGTSISGVFAWGAPDGIMTGWNITTGQELWTFDPNTPFDYWSFSLGSGYGMIYGHNQNAHFYAINATTGELVWDATSKLFDKATDTTYLNGVGYSGTFSMAGGYVYVQMGENQYKDPDTGLSGKSEFNCYDAYTGELIWSLPYENGAPKNLQCNAYGNLYMIPVSTSSNGPYTYTSMPQEGGVTLGQVICLGNGAPQDWSMYANDPLHTASGWGPTNLEKLWSKTIGDGYLGSSPSFSGGIGYIGSSDHKIYAFNATTGDKIWNYSTNYIIQSTPAIVDGKVYTGADDGNVYCLDATTGGLNWKTQLSNKPVTNLGFGYSGTGGPPSPILVDNNLYIAANNFVYDLNPDTGALKWNFSWGSANVIGTPTVYNGKLYVAPDYTTGANGFLYVLNANTGTLLLNVTLPYATNPFGQPGWLLSMTAGSNGIGIEASPTLDITNNLVLVRQILGSTWAIDATTGNIVWTYNASYNPGTPQQWGTHNTQAVLSANGIEYFNDYYSIVAVNATDGSTIWNTYIQRETCTQTLSYSNGKIYAASMSGLVYVLDAKTGAKLSYGYVSAGELGATPVPYAGKLYVAAGDWTITCFGEAVASTITTTTITFELRPNTITRGETVTVAGSISGVTSAVPMTVYFSKGDSSNPISISATTDGNGGFTVKYTPDMTGDWTVVASWAGDATHSASSSQIQTLTVTEPATPMPTQTPQSMADIYFLPMSIAIIVAIIVVGIATMLTLRKKP
jgi:outer membrane protein assembly factor BamB